MKIGILTQHLHNNYGGLLQAFALQYYLAKKGHDVITVDFTTKDIGATVVKRSIFNSCKDIAINFIRKFILKRDISSVLPLSELEKASIGSETRRFVAENIKTTQKLTTLQEIDYLDSYNFEAYIVGSDQVWRPRYSPSLPVFFLSFLSDKKNIKRVSYAASFGTDNCDEYSNEELVRYSALLRKFNGVSVREDVGVELCKKHFFTSALQVIDPTLLLEPEVYIDLVFKDKIPKSNGNMMVYVLDKATDKKAIIQKVVDITKLKPYTIEPDKKGKFPPVTKWLRGFIDAEYVVTDSFHGVAFSILFNKQFIAIGNKKRGLARFVSILKKFSLEDRLILNIKDLSNSVVLNKIDYAEINKIRSIEKNKAYDFLSKSLES